MREPKGFQSAIEEGGWPSERRGSTSATQGVPRPTLLAGGSASLSARTQTSLLLVLVLGISLHPARAQVQTSSNSNPAPSPHAVESDFPSWLFPIDKLNQQLPTWLHIGGEYRDRLEGPIGSGFTDTSDSYVLDRLRLSVAIQSKDWLKFFGEVQDARIFFNHHIPNANP